MLSNEIVCPCPPRGIVKTKKLGNESWKDTFSFLEKENDPRTEDYIRAENRYAERVLRQHRDLIDSVKKEIKGRIPRVDTSVPVEINGYRYFSRSYAGKDYCVYYRHKTGEKKNEVILDVNALAKPEKCCMVTGLAVSPCTRYLLYGVNFNGGITYQIHVRDLHTGKNLPFRIPETDGEGIWSEDGRFIFYAKREPGNLRCAKIMRHEIGRPIAEDTVVFSEPDVEYECCVWKTKSDRYIMLTSSSSDTTETWYLDAHRVASEPRVILPRVRGVEYYPEDRAGEWVLLSNERAEDFKVTAFPIGEPENIKTLIPYTPGVLLDDLEIFDDFMVCLQRRNAQHEILVFDFKNPQLSPVRIAYEGNALAFDENPNLNARDIRFLRTSMTCPDQILSYNFDTQKIEVLKTAKIKGFDEENYVSKMVYAPSRDGVTKIPVTLAWRKDKIVNGQPAPMMLRGYGAYGISFDPAFRASRLSLLDRGVITAIAHVRGGEEMGRIWYQQGRLLHKPNTFNDFIDVVRYLINEKITTPTQLAIGGGSAGGLLMGAVVNQAPELFKLAVMDVPFVDVLNTMINPKLPLTTGEYNEWGNPAQKPFFDVIRSYAPYENLHVGDYPILYITGNLNDEQVPYWEPLKFTARLRTLNPNRGLILMRTDCDSGHMGPTGRKAEISEIAKEMGFVLSNICKFANP